MLKMPRSFLIKKHQKMEENGEIPMENEMIETINICDDDTDQISDSNTEELCVLPTPPDTPDFSSLANTPISNPEKDTTTNERKFHGKKEEKTTIIRNVDEKTVKKNEPDFKFERRRDPIGQLLDSLCKANMSKQNVNTNINAKTVSHESAFKPIYKSPSPQYLPRCEQFCVQGTVDYFHSPQALGVYRRETVTPPHLPLQTGSMFGYGVLPPSTHPHFHPSMMQNDIRNFQNTRQLFPPQISVDMFAAGYRNAQSPEAPSPFSFPWISWTKNTSAATPKFSDVTYKETHPVSHPPRYQCEACNKSYSTFGGLSKHKQFHCVSQIKKEFTCKYCEKTYGSLGALKMHIRTHTLPCKCKLCGKAFSRPWLLQGHLRTHTGEKPYRCEQCGRAFADRSNLRAHLQTHSDIKKYGCKMCSKTFSRMSLLLKHEDGSCSGMRR